MDRGSRRAQARGARRHHSPAPAERHRLCAAPQRARAHASTIRDSTQHRRPSALSAPPTQQSVSSAAQLPNTAASRPALASALSFAAPPSTRDPPPRMSSQEAQGARRSAENPAEPAARPLRKDGNEAPAPPAAGPSSPRPSSSGRPASFAAVSASLASFFSGHSKQSSAEKSDPAAPSQPAVTLHPPSSAADGDTFAPLPPAAVLADLFPDADTRAAVTEFWHERALEWSLDPRTLGGERSASNRGAAALFRLVSSATLTSRRGAAEPGSSVRSSDVASGESSTERDEPPAAAGDRSQDLATSGQRQFQKSYETHDVLRAIEQKDTELLMHIRDINFDLLLDLQSGTSAGLGGGSGAAGVSTPLG